MPRSRGTIAFQDRFAGSRETAAASAKLECRLCDPFEKIEDLVGDQLDSFFRFSVVFEKFDRDT